ncbi:N(4)-(Beta-N-acetylglucosaminyl)-L-asparaginase-like isoform X2 [Montipora capricornis]|uniref:N(4)-(Beta-N-acetylglucosaminyl)-L-asparaginase- like isoform X2 n=1 Tax=Montipora foliosa TaxID=591990 RepID=UPI0035F17FF2
MKNRTRPSTLTDVVLAERGRGKVVGISDFLQPRLSLGDKIEFTRCVLFRRRNMLAVVRVVLLWVLFSRIAGDKLSEKTKDVTAKFLPVVINTWGPPFTNATSEAWQVISSGKGSAVDAIESGCTVCEEQQCDGTVGFGGSPDELGETTLDAMIMDGVTHNVGAVGCLKRVKRAISVARSVMEHTTETFLVGDDATRFALQMGFKSEDLQTNHSRQMWKDWKKRNCQPNCWKDVIPDPRQSCGPYSPKSNDWYVSGPRGTIRDQTSSRQEPHSGITKYNHDTIGMVVVDGAGNLAGGTSTNGRNHKIPGFHAVELMRQGKSPTEAASLALKKIAKYYPKYNGALVAVNKQGEFGAAAYGWTYFKYSVCNPSLGKVTVFSVKPIDV